MYWFGKGEKPWSFYNSLTPICGNNPIFVSSNQPSYHFKHMMKASSIVQPDHNTALITANILQVLSRFCSSSLSDFVPFCL